MSRGFPLAGLLRLKQLHEDAAAIELAAANAQTSTTRARQRAARLELADLPSDVVNAAALNSVAAARSSSRSMLAELSAVSEQNRATAAQAQAAFNEARSQSVRLQKLETQHEARVAAQDLHTEQTAIDEIASGAWQRRRGVVGGAGTAGGGAGAIGAASGGAGTGMSGEAAGAGGRQP